MAMDGFRQFTETLQDYVPLPTFDSAIWGAFLTILGIFAIYSLLLLYHWLRYGSLYATTWIMMIVYFGTSFLLLSTMFGATIALT